MTKFRLFTPGPTMVPDDVLLEMAQPIQHHRTAFYRDLLKEVTEGLQYVFQTKATCLTVSGSGTSAMEGAIVACSPPGTKALIARGGKFGERWATVCETFGIDHTVYEVEWGHGAKADRIREQLDADAAIKTVIVVHSETSTAAVSEVREIAAITRERDVLLIVDGITAVGAIESKMDEWGVDITVTGSQKAMMLPPGLGFAAVNDRAWERIESWKPPLLYTAPAPYRKALATFDAPYTPAIPQVRGARVSLRRIRDEGIESVWKRTTALARATRAAAEPLGLKVFAADPVDSVTALTVPENIDEPTLLKRLRAEFGLHLAGGQDRLKGRIIRLSHMGYIDALDTIGAIAGLEQVLKSMGQPIELGAAVGVAQHSLAAAG